MAGSPVSRALRTFKVAEAEFVAAKCYALRAMIGTRTDPTAGLSGPGRSTLTPRRALSFSPGGPPSTWCPAVARLRPHKSLDTLRGYGRSADLFKEHAGPTFL